ncbi:hypothetical protein P389DRAFT_194629 [Cystobasidium minutum MCA 4210]|uniref:uncharacterized protein n=1 Tax=Cystobasidium minutum MCA 4210 TaxID=1397322 RepID=UPI0034CE9844|eukprot:jgi/Rhomi1/194629/gm1.2843_g
MTVTPSNASLLRLSVCTLAWCVGTASSHVIQRTSVASASGEPVFTIQTSMPSIPTTTNSGGPRECFSNGSTFLCSTSTRKPSGDQDPVFCPAPTLIPSGLCFATITYTLAPTQIANNSIATSSAKATTSTTISTYPCAERTTTYSSATYALNCIDDEANYVSCPSNITLTPTAAPSSTTSSSFTTSTTIADCFDDAGSTISCSSSSSTRRSTSCTASDCTVTSIPTPSIEVTATSIQRTRSIITQCFNINGTPTSCPLACESPFETAPGPVVPTASLTLESQGSDSSSSSEKIFRTSPAPIITSFASAPAFLSNA